MTTNQPTQPDMFEPPEKFGNYLADKSLAAFNQPTDATIGVCSMEQEYMNDTTQKLIAANHRLTAQLAAKQAEAKAWEAWGNEVDRLASAIRRQHSGPCGQDSLSMERNQAAYKTATQFKKLCLSRPQPVDASSLARIARVALEADKKTRKFRDWAEINFRHTLCPDFEQWFSDKYFDTDEDQALDKSCQTLTPNDIALAKALVGGAS